MNRLTLADLGGLLRISEQSDCEERLAAFPECDTSVAMLMHGRSSVQKARSDIATPIPQLVANLRATKALEAAWNAPSNSRVQVDEHGTRLFEAYPIIDRASFTEQVTWHPFEARFARSLEREASVPRTLALALGGALSDMVDNVVQHSGSDTSHPARAVAAYFANEQECGFGVIDSGRGALASLRSNQAWQGLDCEAAAIEAILTKGATRRAENSFGDGYRDLFRAIVDHEFQVLVWSGDALTTVEADHGERRELARSALSLPGFAILLVHRNEIAT